MRISLVTLLLSTFLVAVMPWAGHAQEQQVGELARQAQNPVADLISACE